MSGNQGSQNGIVATTLPSFPWQSGQKLDAVPLNNAFWAAYNMINSIYNAMSVLQGAVFTGISATLNWGGGSFTTPGTYIVTANAPYEFTIFSADSSVGNTGGSFLYSVVINNVPITGLNLVSVNTQTDVNTRATANDNVVLAGSTVAIVITAIGGSPANGYVCINSATQAPTLPSLILDDPAQYGLDFNPLG